MPICCFLMSMQERLGPVTTATYGGIVKWVLVYKLLTFYAHLYCWETVGKYKINYICSCVTCTMYEACSTLHILL